MGSIVAFKNNKKRVFNDVTWKLLGKDHDGWVAASDQLIDNVTSVNVKTEKPSTGEKVPVKKEPVISEEDASAARLKFEKAAVGIAKGVIKDYMDKNGIAYDNTQSRPVLIGVLGEHLKYSTSELQKILS